MASYFSDFCTEGKRLEKEEIEKKTWNQNLQIYEERKRWNEREK